MAALTLANIPSSINTYERLAVWAIQCCQSIANGQESDNVDRFVLTAYIPLDRDALNSSTAKTWMAANDIASAAPHSNLLSN
jgi:hypothetical protein